METMNINKLSAILSIILYFMAVVFFMKALFELYQGKDAIGSLLIGGCLLIVSGGKTILDKKKR